MAKPQLRNQMLVVNDDAKEKGDLGRGKDKDRSYVLGWYHSGGCQIRATRHVMLWTI